MLAGEYTPRYSSKENLVMRKHLTTVILVILLLAGVSLLLYPTVSDYWNSFHQTQAIASYTEQVADLNQVDYDKLISDARAYNRKLADKPSRFILTEDEREEYNSLLDVAGNGIIGYIEIPKIRCSLPIYHGMDDTVLQIAVGHIEGSSLPVGGKSTHCVLSGHRGLPRAKLFTDIDKLEKGDTFMIRVLDETLTYEVDQIRIVLPDEMEDLKIIEGKDLCTLVTCTPYGVNSHRLLVRGHRVANAAGDIRVTADALQIDPLIVAPAAAVPLLTVLLIYLLLPRRGKGERRNRRR